MPRVPEEVAQPERDSACLPGPSPTPPLPPPPRDGDPGKGGWLRVEGENFTFSSLLPSPSEEEEEEEEGARSLSRGGCGICSSAARSQSRRGDRPTERCPFPRRAAPRRPPPARSPAPRSNFFSHALACGRSDEAATKWGRRRLPAPRLPPASRSGRPLPPEIIIAIIIIKKIPLPLPPSRKRRLTRTLARTSVPISCC